jgi:Surface antigen variable number repeat
MRFLVGFLLVSSLANAVLGQSRPVEPACCVRIGSLTIESKTLSAADRERIVRLLREKTYPESEIGERVREAVRTLGYINAVVEEPQLSFQAQERDIADVTVKVDPGVQYRLAEIRFEGETVLPPQQLRDAFSQQRGDLFNATKLGAGMERLRELYANRGYINMVASPAVMTDESRRTINLVLEVDEGQPFDFGKLYLEGIEPRPGAGKALLDSWKSLQGNRYNAAELQRWLLANHYNSKLSAPTSSLIKTTEEVEARVANITLTQWPNQKYR